MEGCLVTGINSGGETNPHPYLVKIREGFSPQRWGVKVDNLRRCDRVCWDNYPSNCWIVLPKEMA